MNGLGPSRARRRRPQAVLLCMMLAAGLAAPAQGAESTVAKMASTDPDIVMLLPIGDGIGDALEFTLETDPRPGFVLDEYGDPQVPEMSIEPLTVALKFPGADSDLTKITSSSATITAVSGTEVCRADDSSTWPQDEYGDYVLYQCPSVKDVWDFSWTPPADLDPESFEGYASIEIRELTGELLATASLQEATLNVVEADPSATTYYPYRDGVKDWANVTFYAEAVGGTTLNSTAVAEVFDQSGNLIDRIESLDPRPEHVFRIDAPQLGVYTVVATLETPFGSGDAQATVTAAQTRLTKASIKASTTVIRPAGSPKAVTISSAMTTSTGKPASSKGSVQVLRGSTVVATLPVSRFNGTVSWNGRIKGVIIPGSYSLRGVFKGPEGSAVTTSPVKVSVAGFTITPSVSAPSGSKVLSKKISVKQGKRTVVSNKASAQVGSGTYTVTSKVTYQPRLYKKVWKTKTKINTQSANISFTKCRVGSASVLDDRTEFVDYNYLDDALSGQATILYVGRCDGQSKYVSWQDDVHIYVNWDGYSSRDDAILMDSSVLGVGDVDYVYGSVVLAWKTKVRYQATVGYWGSARVKTSTRTVRF